MQQSINYVVTEDDLVEALRHHWRPSRAMFSLQLFIGTFVILMMFFGPTEMIQLLALACVLTFFLTRRVIGPWIQRNTYRKSPILQEPLKLSFDDEGFSLEGESGQSTIVWDRFLKWKDSDTYVLLYISPRQYYIVPKRLRDEDFDVDTLVSLLQENVTD